MEHILESCVVDDSVGTDVQLAINDLIVVIIETCCMLDDILETMRFGILSELFRKPGFTGI